MIIMIIIIKQVEESVKRNILSGKSANLEKSLKKKTSLLGCSPYNLLCTSPSSSSHQKQTKLKGKSYSLLIFLCTSPSSRVRYNIPPPSSFFYTFLLLLPVSVFVCVSLKTALLKGFFTQGAPLLTLKEEEKKRKATKKPATSFGLLSYIKYTRAFVRFLIYYQHACIRLILKSIVKKISVSVVFGKYPYYTAFEKGYRYHFIFLPHPFNLVPDR